MHMSHNIILPSKPRIVSEDIQKGVYEIDNLAPGYGHTLGNSLRRIIISSLPGAAVTIVKITGATHEFSVLDGIKEDVITILLNLKKIRFKLVTDEPQTVTLSVKGPKVVTASDITLSGQVEVLNGDQFIAELTDKNAKLEIEITIEKGLGFVPKEIHQKPKVDIGTIAVDAIFTPIRRASYEVENMRVGDKTDHNRLRLTIETDGTISPREALERSIDTMITQLQAIVGFKQPVDVTAKEISTNSEEGISEDIDEDMSPEKKEEFTDAMKTRIEGLDLGTRTMNALTAANIRTVGGLARKKKEDLLELPGMGEKGISEITKVLAEFGVTLK